ncbi:LacI family DNA-binding transcriptional regulator [Micromonospora sp. NPDC002717]|uniref:LacI family DNA-binding transcriptional regulator n=1 Tax=unclassified Micromonospora TaxID=2617518 RepID=UPI003332E7D7
MKRPTIYSIAEACGVSASTVSRAFSRPHVVNAELRERIHAAAREVGYQPNKAARGLVTGRTGLIGLLVPDITNPFFPPLVRAIQQAADKLDSSVLLVDTEERAAAEPQLIRHLAGQVDGLLLASPRSSSGLKDKVNDLPCVVINRRIRGLPGVTCDNTRALQAAGRHLEQLGHRRVAMMRGPSASWAARQRADAIHAWAVRSDVTLVDLGPFAASFEGGLAAARALLDTDCTATFAFDDLMACGVLAGLADAGVRVPEERSVIGCDDVLLARTVTPRLTTVTAPVQRLGHVAVELLQRCGSGEPTEEIRLDGELTLRASTGPAA